MRNYAEIAKKHFNNKKQYHNCTQAILRAYQAEFNISDELITECKTKGGSHSTNGMCGALFAACLLLEKDKEMVIKIIDKFIAKFGSTKCPDLRHKERELCSEYVEFVALLVNKYA